MDITYLGHSSFKIKTKTATVITDPFDPQMVGLKFPPNEAEIVTVSHDHKDHNYTEKISGVKKVLTGPGEYEIAGVSVIGYPSFHDAKNGEERGKNTIFIFEADGLRVAHLGDVGHKLSDDLIGQIGSVDVLMIPVGGKFTVGAKEAAEMVGEIDPYFIIPMHYKEEGISADFGELEPVENFTKELGLPVENLPKFSIKREDITDDTSSKVVILSAKG